VAELQRQRAAFLTARPARPFIVHVQERASHRPFPWFRFLLPAATAFALVTVLLVFVGGQLPDDVSLKGAAPQLRILVSRQGAEATEWAPTVPLREGDLLKFAVTLPSDGFLFVANLDSQGHVSRYFPTEGRASQALRRGEHLLPGSVALDAVQGDELIIAVVSNAALTEAQVSSAASKAFAQSGQRLEAIEALELPGATAIKLHHKTP